MKPTPQRYPLPLAILHWIAVPLVPIALASGWYVIALPDEASSRGYLSALHISLGLTLAIVALAYLILRVLLKAPPLPDEVPPPVVRVDRSVNLLTGSTLLLMPLAGYLRTVFSGSPAAFWGIPLPVWGVTDDGLAEFFGAAHAIMGYALAGSIVAHIAIMGHSVARKNRFWLMMFPAPKSQTHELAPVQPASPDAAKIGQHVARNLRLLGWTKFWLQLLFALMSGFLLLFATSGRFFSPASAGFGDSLFWGTWGFILLLLSISLTFLYPKKARALPARLDTYFSPRRKLAFWFLGVDMLLGAAGIFISLAGVALSISLLIAKTISQPPGIAITDPIKIIRAMDVFILLLNFNLLIAHFLGVAIALWLAVTAWNGRHEYLLTLSAQSGNSEQPQTTPNQLKAP